MKLTIILTSLAVLVLITITSILLYINSQAKPVPPVSTQVEGTQVEVNQAEEALPSCADQPGTAWCTYTQTCLSPTDAICPPEITADFDQIGLVTKAGETQGQGLNLINSAGSFPLIFTADSWCGDATRLIPCLALSVSDYGLVANGSIRIMGQYTADGIAVLRAIHVNHPATETSTSWVWPLSDAEQRITKKPFGLHVSPGDSPVSPEKFSGYHTGTDFEILASEEGSDVPVTAICDGALRVKRWSSGYGGVAVQDCQLDSQAVTVIYGHLRLDSITSAVGDTLKTGHSFAVLGEAYSAETDQERPHLHLAIHRGSAINLLGYVAEANQLADWLDITSILLP